MHSRLKNKKTIFSLFVFALLIGGGFFLVKSGLAQEDIDCSECGVVPCGSDTCHPDCEYCTASPANTSFENLITATSTKQIVDKIADFIAYIGFPAAIIALIYAGIRLLLAQGNEQKVQAAKRTLIWTVIGVTIIISTYVIINTIFKFWETKGFQ
jgi:hypothetical protein